MCHIVQYTMHGNTYHTIQTFYGKKEKHAKSFLIMHHKTTFNWGDEKPN